MIIIPKQLGGVDRGSIRGEFIAISEHIVAPPSKAQAPSDGGLGLGLGLGLGGDVEYSRGRRALTVTPRARGVRLVERSEMIRDEADEADDAPGLGLLGTATQVARVCGYVNM